MRILGLDTSSLAASCALWEEGRLAGEFFCNTGLTHSQTAMPMVQALLACAGRRLEEVDALAVSVGPGSFTGLRIGLSAVKGMAVALEKPCIGVSTLESLAWNVRTAPGLIVPVMDARCAQVYTALFRSEGQEIRRLEQDQAIAIEALEEKLLAFGEGPVLLVGDGALLCQGRMTRLACLAVAPEELRHQRAASVCAIASRKAQLGELLSPDALEPSYLRLAQAQRELLKKQGKLPDGMSI